VCKHQYQLFEVSNTECPFPKLFDRYADHFDFELEYDQHGVCIFHSKDIEWKRDRILIHMVDSISAVDQINETYGEVLPYHFIEFQIVNCDNGYNLTTDLNLTGYLDFRGAVFHNSVKFSKTKFGTANFGGVEIKNFAGFHDCTFDKLQFSNAKIDGISFHNCEVSDYALFTDSSFHLFGGFTESQFKGTVSFENCEFNTDDFQFKDSEFWDTLILSKAKFQSGVNFSNLTFHKTAKFIDTFFDSACDVTFHTLKVNNFLTFKSTNEGKKLFNNTVVFDVKSDDITGRIIFENVNFLNIFREHRENLLALQKEDKVEIGKGCIKYRLRSPMRRLEITESNQNLVTELTNTFIQFFQVSNGINLGVEIENRTDSVIEFYYFSDEDLAYSEFKKMLSITEREMWRLVKVCNQSIINPKESKSLKVRDKYILATDAMINLVSIILKVGTRLSVGKINRNEIDALFSLSSGKNMLESQQIENLNINQTIILRIDNSQNLTL